jgi:hypothetical protein
MFLPLLAVALARPTDGAGMWTYDETDTVAAWDAPGGLVRVWYSTTGTNAVLPDDTDGDGVPDFVADVGVTSEAVLENFDVLGVARPLGDHGEGGDDRLDVYLVDFAGNADGNWATEGCDGDACYGYFQMENDFSGYGYSDLHTAVKVLTSHELFHGVQAAYGSTDAVWFLEGTATWAEDAFDPGSSDFLHLCEAYLDDTGRSLYEPPGGPVPPFAYGTALWWWYLTNAYGVSVMADLLVAMGESGDDAELIAAMVAIEAQRGGDGADDFTTFSRWNLATGRREGAAETYPFADRLGGIRAEASGSAIADNNRFYPMATTYYELDWAGGELFFTSDAPGEALRLSLHEEGDDGNVRDADQEFTATGERQSLGEVGAGTWWLVVTNPSWAANSTKITVCLGAAADMAACEAESPDDTGDTDNTGDTGEGGSDPEDPVDEQPACGCASPSAGAGSLLGVTVAGALLRGRRRP